MVHKIKLNNYNRHILVEDCKFYFKIKLSTGDCQTWKDIILQHWALLSNSPWQNNTMYVLAIICHIFRGAEFGVIHKAELTLVGPRALMRSCRHRPPHALLRARIPFSADSARNFDTLVLSSALYAYSASHKGKLGTENHKLVN